MKKIALLILPLLGFGLPLLGIEFEWPKPIDSHTQKNTISYRVTYSDFTDDYPNWDPQQKADPPLQFFEAVEIAKNEARENLKLEIPENTGLSEFGVTEVSLKEIASGKWCYIITIYTFSEYIPPKQAAIAIPEGFFMPEFISIPVYFDRRVPSVIIEKRTSHNKSGDDNSE